MAKKNFKNSLLDPCYLVMVNKLSFLASVPIDISTHWAFGRPGLLLSIVYFNEVAVV